MVYFVHVIAVKLKLFYICFCSREVFFVLRPIKIKVYKTKNKCNNELKPIKLYSLCCVLLTPFYLKQENPILSCFKGN